MWEQEYYNISTDSGQSLATAATLPDQILFPTFTLTPSILAKKLRNAALYCNIDNLQSSEYIQAQKTLPSKFLFFEFTKSVSYTTVLLLLYCLHYATLQIS